jgi:4'-phosphopantetheinyl transferase EntD
VLDVILATPAERAALADLTDRHPAIHWDRLLFSAKETVYKAWYPYHRRMLGFNEAELLFGRDPDPEPAPQPEAQSAAEPEPGPAARSNGSTAPAASAATFRGTYTARLLIPGPLLAEGIGPEVFSGRWIVRDGLVVTAIVVPNERNGSAANPA